MRSITTATNHTTSSSTKHVLRLAVITSSNGNMRVSKEQTTDHSARIPALAGMAKDGKTSSTKDELVAGGNLNMLEKGSADRTACCSSKNARDTPITVPSTRKLKFTCFPRLPAELRLKIWRSTFPGPRIIDTIFDSDDNGDLEVDGMRINQPPPIALGICRESRQEALKRYRVFLSTKHVPSYDPIDPTRDTLYLQWCGGEVSAHSLISAPNLMEKGVLSEIQYLAVDIDVWMFVLDEAYNGLLTTLSEFTALREVAIVLHDKSCRDSWRMKSTREEFSTDHTICLGHLFSRGYEDLEEDIMETFQEVQDQYPDWEMPQIRLTTLKRGGEPCCYDDVERAMLMPGEAAGYGSG